MRTSIYSIEKLNVAHFRRALLSGLLIYDFFGLLDYFALPENYLSAWAIRYLIISPFLLLGIIYAKKKWVVDNASMILFLLIFFGQVGISSMLLIAERHEAAYTTYYAGLILVAFWSGMVFRLRLRYVITFASTNVLLYTLIVFFWQDDLLEEKEGIAIVLNNVFFLVSTSIISVIGSYNLHLFYHSLLSKNDQLKKDRRIVEESLKKAEMSDKLKSAFLANVSHEIRTPMNSIIGFTSCLVEDDYPPEEQKEFLGLIQQSSERLLKVINDILDISKIDADSFVIEPFEFDVCDLMEELQKYYTPIANRKGLELEVFFENNIDTVVFMDRDRLFQIITNLIINAIKFTKKGKVRLGCNFNPESIDFLVEDSGIGIPKEKHDFVFERFGQVDSSNTRSYQGAGLGLSISREMIERMGGEIWLDSEPEIGTTFFVSFPKSVVQIKKG